MGSAPAPGRSRRRLVVGIPVRGCRSKEHARHTKVRREGAPNSSQGGCAPLRSLCLLPVPMDWGARPPRAQPTTPSSSASLCAGADQNSLRATPTFGARLRRTAAGAAALPSVLSVCSPFQWIGERARPGRSRRRPRRRHRSARVQIKRACAPHQGSARGRAEQQPGRAAAPLRLGTLLTWENSPALARRWNSSIAS